MHEVYAVDVLVSTGEGKVRRTEVYGQLFCFVFSAQYEEFVNLFIEIRQRMEVKGPQFTNETPTRCTA